MCYVKFCRIRPRSGPGKVKVMNKTRILSIALVVCLVALFACAYMLDNIFIPTTSDDELLQSPNTSTDTSVPPESSLPPVTEPPVVVYRNPLTGELIDEPMTARPFAVMLNNYEASMPVHGISEADIVYEALTEGGWTRCMGIYSDLASVKNMGCVRSARRHFVNLAIAYDAIYVHFGRSTGKVGAQEYMEQMGWDHMDGIDQAYAYFYENEDRLNSGYALDAVHFLVGQRAIDYAKRYDFALEREEPYDYGMNFNPENAIAGEGANQVTVWFNEGGTPNKWHKYTKFFYDETSNLYRSYQYGKDNVDGNTGEIISYSNVLALHASTKKNDTTSHMIIDLEGEGTGYYAYGGKIVSIKWSRDSVYDPFTYTLEDGTPVTFGVGKTYIAIIPTNATVEWN